MKSAGVVAAVWLLVLATAAGQVGAQGTDNPERIARWEEWQEEPLDLRTADRADIADLPGMDPELAGLVVGLREAGELRTLDDLGRIPGIDRDGVEAIQPYVRLDAPGPRAGLDWQTVSQARRTRPTGWRQVLGARVGAVEMRAVRVDDAVPIRRAGASVALGLLRVRVGEFRVRNGLGALFSDGRSRSRLGTPHGPLAPGLRLRTDSSVRAGWTGVVLEREDSAFFFVGRDPLRIPTAGLALALPGESLSAGGAVRVSRRRVATSAWMRRSTRQGSFVAGGATDGGSRAISVSASSRGPGWRAGVSATDVDGPLKWGADPVTGRTLDRRHAALQLHARLRGRGWSGGAIWREQLRGRLGAELRSTSVEIDGRWRPRVADANVRGLEKIELNLRLEPVLRAGLVVVTGSPHYQIRARYSRQGGEDGGSDISSVEFRNMRSSLRWSFAAAWVEGGAGRPWAVSRPGTGMIPVWLAPGETGLAAGCGGKSASGTIGAWGWVVAGPSEAVDWGLGLAWRLSRGDVVRRLQRGG